MKRGVRALLAFGIAVTSLMTIMTGMARDVEPSGFVSSWLICGPYPSYQHDGEGDGLDTDFIGEKTIRPYPGLEDEVDFMADRGRLIAYVGAVNEWGYDTTRHVSLSWRKMTFANPKRIELTREFLPIEDYFAYYAACWIESPEDQEVEIRLGSDDDHKLFLNGEMISRSKSSQAILADKFIVRATLMRGVNSVLLKIVDRRFDTGFCLRVTDKEGAPVQGLKYYSDDPRLENGLDILHEGFGAAFTLTPGTFREGEPQKVFMRFHAPDGKPYSVSLNGIGKMMRSGETGEWTFDFPAGKTVLHFSVEQGPKKRMDLSYPLSVNSRDAARMEEIRLRHEILELEKEQREWQSRLERSVAEKARLKEDVHQAILEAEKAYEAMREDAVSRGRESVDIPLPDAVSRKRIVLNGEWRIGSERDALDGKAFLPTIMHNAYFIKSHNPFVWDEKKGTCVPRRGWEDFPYDFRLCDDDIWFSKEFDLDELPQKARFLSEGIFGRIELYCNDALCGEYAGRLGMVEIPLDNLKKGKNELKLHFQTPQKVWDIRPYDQDRYGLRGDMFVECCGDVRVKDIWVKTSWRRGTLSTATEVENNSGKTRKLLLRQYAVSEGRIRFALPEQTLVLAPGESRKTTVSAVWGNPILWSLENPFQYDLVSDIVEDGFVIDRCHELFGFREFWIHGTEFFFNGKNIRLYGDVGSLDRWNLSKICDVTWPLLRHDGINILRNHDGAYYSMSFLRSCDRLGMFAYVNMYPQLGRRTHADKGETPISEDEWFDSPLHRFNLDNYIAWWKMIRNHPSVVIISTDNEVVTQANDKLEQVELNMRNEHLAAWYEKFVKSLDPDMVLTRDGDIGTWNHQARWFEAPPCDTANYHYPDYDNAHWAVNWPDVYEERPVIFGEVLYSALGGNLWLGAREDVVAKQAERVRRCVSIYVDEEVPACIFMGPLTDCFLTLRADGGGSPWGFKGTSEKELHELANTPDLPRDIYPFWSIPWPAKSGLGPRPLVASVAIHSYSWNAINWFDSSRLSHVRNATNDAYRDTLPPQPPIPPAYDAECIIKTTPGALVWCLDTVWGRMGIYADEDGKAWFHLPFAGSYWFESQGKRQAFNLPERGENAFKPGFDDVPLFVLE